MRFVGVCEDDFRSVDYRRSFSGDLAEIIELVFTFPTITRREAFLPFLTAVSSHRWR